MMDDVIVKFDAPLGVFTVTVVESTTQYTSYGLTDHIDIHPFLQVTDHHVVFSTSNPDFSFIALVFFKVYGYFFQYIGMLYFKLLLLRLLYFLGTLSTTTIKYVY